MDDSTILIITASGLQLSAVVPPKQALRNLKTLSTTVDAWCYDAQHGLLVVRNHSRPRTLKGYHVDTQGVARMTELQLPEAPAPGNTDMQIAVMYDRVFLLLLNSERQELSLYLVVGRDTFELHATINLFGEKPFGVNVVDNLLVVHNLRNELSMVFDPKLLQRNQVLPKDAGSKAGFPPNPQPPPSPARNNGNDPWLMPPLVSGMAKHRNLVSNSTGGP